MESRLRYASPKPSRGELLYLRADFQPTSAELETKFIATRNLELLQKESKTPQQLKPSMHTSPLVLKFTKERFDPNLTCFLEAKATESYRRRLERQPRFSEEGEMTVKVCLSRTERRRKLRKEPQYPASYLQRMGLVEDTGLPFSTKDKATLKRLKASLTTSLMREYIKEKREKSIEERYRETRLFGKPPNSRHVSM